MFELGGDSVPASMAANLTRLIAEGGGEGDEDADRAMRADIVASYLDLLPRPKLSDVLLTVRRLPLTPPLSCGNSHADAQAAGGAETASGGWRGGNPVG